MKAVHCNAECRAVDLIMLVRMGLLVTCSVWGQPAGQNFSLETAGAHAKEVLEPPRSTAATPAQASSPNRSIFSICIRETAWKCQIGNRFVRKVSPMSAARHLVSAVSME